MRGLGDEDSNPPVDPTTRGTSSPTHAESGGGVEDQRGGIPYSLLLSIRSRPLFLLCSSISLFSLHR